MSILGPTVERLRRAPDFDTPVVDDKRRRAAFRIVDVPEDLLRRGRIRPEQASAFRQFEKDFTAARKSSVLLCRYGERASGGGTPLSQLANDLLCPEERRAEAYRKASDAAIAVGEPRSVETLILIVTEPVTLEELGKRVLLIGNKSQARTAAERTVQTATYLLARHYGYIDQPLRPG